MYTPFLLLFFKFTNPLKHIYLGGLYVITYNRHKATETERKEYVESWVVAYGRRGGVGC